jgi:CRISPR type I-D-associated protein Csc2
MSIEKFNAYLGSLDNMVAEIRNEKDEVYVQPALKRLGTVSIVLIRETVAPTIFRNEDAEMTDISIDGERVVRAVPNKLKHRDRSNGLRISRYFGTGGNFPQNRTMIEGKVDANSIKKAFDINSFLFGDSAFNGNVYPVKAAVMYSDALSIIPYNDAVGKTFHNRASEDGSLFDAETKKNSVNLFERHYVLPGVPFVQVLTTIGKVMPLEVLEHLLASIGEANAYGGQTSVTGVNVRTRIVGIYGSNFEKAESSPYEIWRSIPENVRSLTGTELCQAMHEIISPNFELSMGHEEAESERARIMESISNKEAQKSYQDTAEKIGELFAAWFIGGKKDKKDKKDS